MRYQLMIVLAFLIFPLTVSAYLQVSFFNASDVPRENPHHLYRIDRIE